MHRKRMICLFLVVFSFLILTPTNSWANEGDSEKSASVKTEGVITFESTAESTSRSSEAPSSTPPTSLPNVGGKLPKTGEAINQGLTIGGIVLLVSVFLILFWKRKNERSEEGGVTK